MAPTEHAVRPLSPPVALIRGWLATRLPEDALRWLDAQVEIIASGAKPQQLGMSIGLAPRKVGKADLDLSPAKHAEGQSVRAGLDTSGWSLDQAARILLILATTDDGADAFVARIDRIFSSAEIGEHIALLRGLPLYPHASRLLPYAAEGVRSAMQPIFEAVAHRNPYPRENFSDAQWNQMVVKTLFIGSTLNPIQGLDERRNPELARMLVDYAAERKAAGRTISPELWRCVAPFASEHDVQTLSDILRGGTRAERIGAALALSECPLPSARAALSSEAEISAAIQKNGLTWASLA